ncbi:MAG: hypothetical protein OXJ62_15235, partial [Spirochaetaceae bacterium]|nr:hypothetical protein [Spirochaetaceae bacterium]
DHAVLEQRLTERMATKDDLAALEQRIEAGAADMVREGTDKILAAVRELAETKADKSDMEKLKATAGKAFLA